MHLKLMISVLVMTFCQAIFTCEFNAQALEQLFKSDKRWRGGDAAYSVVLSDSRILWLFGDSFIADKAPFTRKNAEMVANSIAIQSMGASEPSALKFYWRQLENRSSSFFPDIDANKKYWPAHGIRVPNGPLILFLNVIETTPDIGLGFRHKGTRLAIIDRVDEAPNHWLIKLYQVPLERFDASPGAAVILQGDTVVSLAIKENGVHEGYLVRYPLAALLKGDLQDAQWWMGESIGWVHRSEVQEKPAIVIPDAGAESSLHWSADHSRWIHVASYGFGASQIGMRTAPNLTGPWSAEKIIFEPPESQRDGAFVYAAKAHSSFVLHAKPCLVMTYATNSFEFSDLLSPQGEAALYWPKVIARILPE